MDDDSPKFPLPRYDMTIHIAFSDPKRIWQALEFCLGIMGSAKFDFRWFFEGGPVADDCHKGAWGGGGSHGHYTILDRGGPSEEEYNEQLEAWFQAKRAEREKQDAQE